MPYLARKFFSFFVLLNFLFLVACSGNFSQENSVNSQENSVNLQDKNINSQEKGINLQENSTNLKALSSQIPPQTILQKRTDAPKDKAIKIVTKDNYTLCYTPTFSAAAQNHSYVGILNCSDSNAKAARYDVFGRLAYNYNDTWLCITAPDSVAVQRHGRDYLYLSPCVINLKTQQWKLKNGSFYSNDESYSIKDDGSYLYAANALEGGLFTHKLHPSMQEWASTIATPGNISLVTFISWTLSHKDGEERYFLANNQSLKNTTELYYNVSSGHIASYDSLAGVLYCMYSNTAKNSWDWVSWGLCTDAKPPKDNKAYFKPLPLDEKHFAFLDKDGNLLRLTRYGIYWGVPYVASREYIKKDTANSPTSSFETDAFMREWLRFINANAGRNLFECPASGESFEFSEALKFNTLLNSSENFNSLLNSSEANKTSKFSSQAKLSLSKNSQNSKPNLQEKSANSSLSEALNLNPPLPRTFRLSEAWINRLYEIGITSDGRIERSGICGLCLLHSYQVLAEILENPSTPRTGGGYFFNTGRGQNPFDSFRRNNRLLYDSLNDIFVYYDYFAAQGSAEFFRREADRAMASNISMLPQYNWRILGEGGSVRELTELMQALLNRPVGSVFLIGVWRLMPGTTTTAGHAMPAIRTSEGLVIIPTNTPFMRLESFRSMISPVQNTAGILRNLTRFGPIYLNLAYMRVFEISSVYHNAFENLTSFNDCSGEGEDRRGNALLPLPELLNQCISGRCEW